MFPRMNKMCPNFHESSSDCELMIVASMHSMLSLQSINNLHRKTQKCPNKCVKRWQMCKTETIINFKFY